MKRWFSVFICFQLLLLNFASAQSEDDIIKNTQQDMITVVAAGAGGAILGLSTLSFYETPSKSLRNIWTGAALGIIAGVIFVAYNSAQKGSEDLVGKVPSKNFSTLDRLAWHQDEVLKYETRSTELSSNLLNLSF
jgi:hypothetical protein